MFEARATEQSDSGNGPTRRRPNHLRNAGLAIAGLGLFLTAAGTVLKSRNLEYSDSIGIPLHHSGLLVLLVGCVSLMIDQRARVAAQRVSGQLNRAAADLRADGLTSESARAFAFGQAAFGQALVQPALHSVDSKNRTGHPVVTPSEAGEVVRAVASAGDLIDRPLAKRSFPLLGLFVLTALSAILVGLVRPVFRDLAAGTIPVGDFLSSLAVASISACILGMAMGATDRRPWAGIGWGALTGLGLGVIAGPLTLVSAEHFSTLLATSLGGSATLLLLAVAARWGRR